MRKELTSMDAQLAEEKQKCKELKAEVSKKEMEYAVADKMRRDAMRDLNKKDSDNHWLKLEKIRTKTQIERAERVSKLFMVSRFVSYFRNRKALLSVFETVGKMTNKLLLRKNIRSQRASSKTNQAQLKKRIDIMVRNFKAHHVGVLTLINEVIHEVDGMQELWKEEMEEMEKLEKTCDSMSKTNLQLTDKAFTPFPAPDCFSFFFSLVVVVVVVVMSVLQRTIVTILFLL